MLGKLINGIIEYPFQTMLINDTYVANPTNEMLIENGYKEVVYETYPDAIEGYTIEQVITETDVITVGYVQKEIITYQII